MVQTIPSLTSSLFVVESFHASLPVRHQVMSPFGPDDLYGDWEMVEAVYNHALRCACFMHLSYDHSRALSYNYVSARLSIPLSGGMLRAVKDSDS